MNKVPFLHRSFIAMLVVALTPTALFCQESEVHDNSPDSKRQLRVFSDGDAKLTTEIREGRPEHVESRAGRIERVVMPIALIQDDVIAASWPSEYLLEYRACGGGEDFTRAGLRKICKCPNLEVLAIRTTLEVDASTIELISELESLIHLEIQSAELQLDAINKLTHLCSLRDLSLRFTNLDDKALVSIAQLQIQRLDVSFTSVTEDGLRVLIGHPTLKSVFVGAGMEVTEQTKQALQPIAILRRGDMRFSLARLSTSSDAARVDSIDDEMQK